MMFWILMAALIVVAIVFVAPALLRKRQLAELDRNAQNVSIARERLDEIAAEHASGAMTDEVFEQSKLELEASLIDDVGNASPAVTLQSNASYGRSAFIAVAILVPLATYFLYDHLGSPQYLELAGANAGAANTAHQMNGDAPATMEELAERLRERLEKNPDDAEGWFLLSKTYMSQEQYPDALAALQKAHELFGDHPTILLGLADAAAMVKGGDLRGEPAEYVEKALQMDPENTTGLWLGGMAAQQNGNYQLAVDRWSSLLPKLQPEPQSQQEVQSLIAEARRLAAEAGVEITVSEPAMPAGKAIQATVSLDDSIRDQLDPGGIVFVFVRAASGPPMPLAAFKTNVAELPLQIKLDDSMAMMPQMKLSAFDEVIVSARVSMSGQPVAQAGDYSSDQVKLQLQSDSSVNLKISHKIEDPAAVPLVEQTAAAAAAPQVVEEELPPIATGPAIKVWVSLAKELQAQARPDDRLFVFAKARSGPPMPLAAFRGKVSDLPMEVTLDDSMAMMPQMKLSGFEEVVVSARIARSGQPTAQPGDFTSPAEAVRLQAGAVGLELVISDVVQ
ncbi:MAG: c-type cytochrome biogenesis protein CcmI [Chromatiales bacterium]|jgi:cytochrome c-type biogenesis protein CcmH